MPYQNDMVTLTELGVIVGVITGPVSLGLVIYKTLKEKPKIELEFVEANWFKRNEHSIVTSFGVHVRIHNKGKERTTIHSAILTIEYEGKKFPMDSGFENIMVESSSSIVKQFIFNLPINQIKIEKEITDAILIIKHTYKTEKMVIPSIKKPA